MSMRLLAFPAFALMALILALGMPSHHAQAADECSLIRSQLFGTGPHDMSSQAYKYNNYRMLLEKTKEQVRRDEAELEQVRSAQTKYLLEHEKTNPMLDLKLRAATERVRADRANLKYYGAKYSAAMTAYVHLSAQYRLLDCETKSKHTEEACSTSPVGTWSWWDGPPYIVTFNADGTASHSGGASGRWERQGNNYYHVHWSWNSDDFFALSSDGRTLTGNFAGHRGTARRRTC